jgi:hypothetical protein
MKLVKLSMVAAATCLLATSAHAAFKTEDRDVKGSMEVVYTKVPGAVNSIQEMFTEGEVYGRLRSNMFWWDNAYNTIAPDNNMWGVGGSLVYKTGFYHGLGATVGFYGAVPLHDENRRADGRNIGRSGKDTYHTRRDGSEGAMGNFAEAFLEYKAGKTNVKIGRQGIDSIMLSTNDTKMIPNTFEAAMIENKDVPDTTIRAAYIMSQKLRDHQSFHSLIASGLTTNGNPAISDRTAYNDDSGRHNGITVATINARGNGDTDPEMIFFTATNKSIKGLVLDAEYVGLKGFVQTVIAEANYKIKLNDAWSLTPGVRYLHQMDDGAGFIGGAALSGSLRDVAVGTASGGYKDARNADSSIIMARLVLESGPLKVSAGYSKIEDAADIIAPWRGFPTGGYTRTMAQVDWLANTKNSGFRVDYDFDKAGLIPGFKAAFAYEDINQDESKGLFDRTVKQFDFWQTFKSLPNTEFRFRVGMNDAHRPSSGDTESYNEYRFEANYLF